jgi:hypothetical protein
MAESPTAKPQPEETDVSSIFDHYRVSARAIWNTAFWPDPDFRNWDSIDRFDEMQRLLFDWLVLEKVDREWPLQDLFRNAIPFFQIIPRGHEPILIQNPRPEGTGYWDHPVNSIKPGQAELLFIQYFDWDRMDYADLRYYRVKIAAFETQPELVGREALIDREHAAVHLVDE